MKKRIDTGINFTIQVYASGGKGSGDIDLKYVRQSIMESKSNILFKSAYLLLSYWFSFLYALLGAERFIGGDRFAHEDNIKSYIFAKYLGQKYGDSGISHVVEYNFTYSLWIPFIRLKDYR